MKKFLSLTFLLAAFNFTLLNAQVHYFGTTEIGGSGDGVIFQYTEPQGIYTLKKTFANTTTGRYPRGSGFTRVGSKLYICTFGGGTNSLGTLVEYDPYTDVLTKKIDFDGTGNGSNPYGTLIYYNSKLYGTTSLGGANGYGTLFEYNPATGILTTLVTFSAAITGNPLAGLTLYENKLYGINSAGVNPGTNNGAIFSYNPNNSQYTILHQFGTASSTGSLFYGKLTAYNGKLYGLASFGGSGLNYGTLFEFDTLTSAFAVKQVFNGTGNGSYPKGALTVVGTSLYGVTTSGGTSDNGTLFKYDPGTNTLTKKVNFNAATNGSSPNCTLVLIGNSLYGTTAGGGTLNQGTIFEYNYITDLTTVNTRHLINSTPINLNGKGAQGELLPIIPTNTQVINNWSDLTMTYGDVHTITATASSTNTSTGISYLSADPTIANVIGNTIECFKEGVTTITATHYGDLDYTYVSASIQVTVLKKALTVTTTDFTREPCDPNPTFPVTISGFVNTDGVGDLDQAPSFSTSAGSFPGSYTIIGAGGLDEQYSFNYVDGTITVSGNSIYPEIIGKNIISVTNEATFTVSPLSSNITVAWYYTGENVYVIGDSISSKFTLYARSNATSGQVICLATYCGFTDTIRHSLTINPFPTLEHFLTRLTCEPVQTDCDSSYIISFNIDKIFETPVTDCSPSGYNDYTDSDVMASLFIGEAYTINLVAGGFPSYFGLWIDYNNDGDFGDAQEMVSANFDPGFQYIVPNILIPNLSSIEGPKRMRIRTRLTRPFTAEESCPDGTEAGETEDYLLNFEIRPTLNAPNFLSPNNDGENDFFVIRGVDFTEENNLLIIDNMGKVILEESDYKNNWPSQDNLASLKDGVYYYIFRNGHSEIKSYLELSR